MQRVDHLVTRRLLDAYADEELDAERRMRVVAHLGGCEQCRHELDLTERLKAHLAWRRVADWHGPT